MTSLRIQEVCRKTGLTKKAIYFYIEQGLIAPDRNVENNYLDFSETDVNCLQIIALLRRYGVPVGEVEELFRYPSMTNFYLHRQLAVLRSQLLQQLGVIRSLSSLLTELPPQYNVNSLKEQVERSVTATEADRASIVCFYGEKLRSRRSRISRGHCAMSPGLSMRYQQNKLKTTLGSDTMIHRRF